MNSGIEASFDEKWRLYETRTSKRSSWPVQGVYDVKELGLMSLVPVVRNNHPRFGKTMTEAQDQDR